MDIKVGDRIRFGHSTTSILEGTVEVVLDDEGLLRVAVHVDTRDGEGTSMDTVIHVSSSSTGVEIVAPNHVEVARQREAANHVAARLNDVAPIKGWQVVEVDGRIAVVSDDADYRYIVGPVETVKQVTGPEYGYGEGWAFAKAYSTAKMAVGETVLVRSGVTFF